MSLPSRRQRPRGSRATTLAAVLHVVLVLSAALCVGSAAAAERVVTVTSDGVRPSVLTVAPGDTVRFVVQDDTFAYRAQSTGGSWRFDSGPVALLSGDYVVPSVLTQEGTYSYRVAQDPPFRGTVVVRGAVAGAAGSAPSAGPVPSPGTVPPLSPVPSTGAATPGGVAPSAGVAPSTGAGPPAPPPAAPETSVEASSAPGALAQHVSTRALGLPAALAALLVLGTGSLLLRTLLAEPVLSDRGDRLRADGVGSARW